MLEKDQVKKNGNFENHDCLHSISILAMMDQSEKAPQNYDVATMTGQHAPSKKLALDPIVWPN